MSAGDQDELGGRDADFLASDYVLGVLDAASRRRAEARLADDPAFADEVATIAVMLMPLAAEVAEIAPPEGVWPRIEAVLGPAHKPQHGPRLWQNLAFWRTLSFGTGGLAVASLAAVAVLAWLAAAPPRPPPMPLIASLAETGGPGHFMVTVDRGHDMVMVVPAALPPGARLVPQLWVIPPGGAPRSLGMVHARKPTMIKVPPALMAALTTRAMLAVSMEPPGGSPTGRPTGPMVASGHLTLA